MTLRRFRLFCLLALAAASLSACGRRGPLELPPDVQARGAALKSEQAAQTKASGAPRAAPGQTAEEAPEPPIPGTIGNRPPAQYPFPLDPLL